MEAAENHEKDGIRNFFASEKAIVELGVGKNMVTSMKYWALYSGIFDVNDTKDLVITEFGKWLIGQNGVDPWMENLSTQWFIH